jgi:hypothetical protein
MPDLDSLIREVLGMVQEEQKKKNFGNNAYAREAAESSQYAKEARDEYNKMYEPANSTTALDRAGKLKEREMINTGAIDLENTKSAGELARQGLANEGAANVANLNLEGTKYSSDQSLKSNETMAGAHKYTADQNFAARKYEVDVGNKGNDSFSTLMSKAIESDLSILSDPKKLAETAQNIRGILSPDIRRKNDYQTDNNNAPSITTPVSTPPIAPTITTVTEKSNIGQQARTALIGPKRTDNPEDYNIFGTKKPSYTSDFIEHSGPAPSAPLRKKKIADMNENEVIAEQNVFNKKYGVNIGGKKFVLPFTPASPMDEWRKSKYGE